MKVQGLKASDSVLTSSWNYSSSGSTVALVNNPLDGLLPVGMGFVICRVYLSCFGGA